VCTVTPHDTIEVYSTLVSSVCYVTKKVCIIGDPVNSTCDDITGGNVLQIFEIAGFVDYFTTTLKLVTLLTLTCVSGYDQSILYIIHGFNKTER